GAPGRAFDRADLPALPQPSGAPAQPGHQALRRRAADARHRAHPAHRGAAAAPRRAHRGPRAGDRPADRAHHRPPEAGGLHDPARRAEFPLRADGRRPSLHRRARAGRRPRAERQARGDPGPSAGVSRRLISTTGRRSGMALLRKMTAAVAFAFAATGAQAQISGDVIKIGVMNDMSGLYADIGGPGSVIAAKMAVEDFGAAKKGMKVEVLAADHQNKPDVGSTLARQWYDVEGVDVIVDVPTSSVALAVNQVTRDKGKAFLVTGAATSDLTGKA